MSWAKLVIGIRSQLVASLSDLTTAVGARPRGVQQNELFLLLMTVSKECLMIERPNDWELNSASDNVFHRLCRHSTVRPTHDWWQLQRFDC